MAGCGSEPTASPTLSPARPDSTVPQGSQQKVDVPTGTALPPVRSDTSVPQGSQQKVEVPAGTALGNKKIGNYNVWLLSTPNPPARGNNTLQAVVADAEGNGINDAQVTFDLNMTNMNMGRNFVTAVSKGSGHYAGIVFFSMGGPWRVLVSIQRPGQALASDRFDFSITR
jgi:hypothetical protein